MNSQASAHESVDVLLSGNNTMEVHDVGLADGAMESSHDLTGSLGGTIDDVDIPNVDLTMSDGSSTSIMWYQEHLVKTEVYNCLYPQNGSLMDDSLQQQCTRARLSSNDEIVELPLHNKVPLEYTHTLLDGHIASIMDHNGVALLTTGSIGSQLPVAMQLAYLPGETIVIDAGYHVHHQLLQTDQYIIPKPLLQCAECLTTMSNKNPTITNILKNTFYTLHPHYINHPSCIGLHTSLYAVLYECESIYYDIVKQILLKSITSPSTSTGCVHLHPTSSGHNKNTSFIPNFPIFRCRSRIYIYTILQKLLNRITASSQTKQGLEKTRKPRVLLLGVSRQFAGASVRELKLQQKYTSTITQLGMRLIILDDKELYEKQPLHTKIYTITPSIITTNNSEK